MKINFNFIFRTAFVRIEDDNVEGKQQLAVDESPEPEIKSLLKKHNKYLSQSFASFKPQLQKSKSFILPYSDVSELHRLKIKKLIKKFFYFKNPLLDRYNINKNFDFNAASEDLAAKEHLVELERTNLNLRRMIQLMSEDATSNTNASKLLLPNKQIVRSQSSLPK